MEIPFHKPYITEDEIEEVIDTLKSGWITMGPKTVKFEEEFSKYIGVRYAVSLNSCTSALHLALRLIGLKEGQNVIIPSMTFTATGEVITYFNAEPRIVDINEDDLTISISCIERAIDKKTKAIIPVDYGGEPADYDQILELAKKYHLFVIEDGAHALPSWYKGRKIGTISDITCFSFYATKTLATGEGGMLVTDNEDWAKRAKVLRLHGIDRDAWKRYTKEGSWYYEVIDSGYKYNMTDIQASLGLAQLRKLEFMYERRKEIAERYIEGLKDISEYIRIVEHHPWNRTSWHLFVIRLNLEALSIDRDRFIEELKKRGVSTSVHFIPLYRHPFYRESYKLNIKDFPNSERIYPEIISLPIYPSLKKEEIDYVIELLHQLVKEYKR